MFIVEGDEVEASAITAGQDKQRVKKQFLHLQNIFYLILFVK